MGYNKIKILGEQNCDYLYVQKTPVDNSAFEQVDSEPIWGENTELLAKFDKNLIGGETDLIESIVGYEIRRKEGNKPYTDFVGTIEKSLDKKFMIDYLPKNNTKYTYYLYPATQTSTDNPIILNPIQTQEVKTDWGYWSLIIADETDNPNLLYINKIFKFELNLNVNEMNNNAVVSVNQNFTRYPTVQYGSANYWSGSLSSLCGFLSSGEDEYIETPNMIAELKELTSDTRRKFLKDLDGNVWEVKITSPIGLTTSNETVIDFKTVEIGWTEVKDASNVSIINNPNLSVVTWLLTETGEVKPYTRYVWDNNAKWDNSFRWTANDNHLDSLDSNNGRNIAKDGESK